VLLIHSPLVGPLTMKRLGTELSDRGFDVVVPDLWPALTMPRRQWRSIVDLAVAAVDNADVIVVHSGAGVLAPLLAERLDPQVVAFVDAVVPGIGASYEPSGPIIEFIDALPHDGPLLPPWTEWWGARLSRNSSPMRICAGASRSTRRVYRDRSTTIASRFRRAGRRVTVTASCNSAPPTKRTAHAPKPPDGRLP
jgi:hypothetical protein